MPPVVVSPRARTDLARYRGFYRDLDPAIGKRAVKTILQSFRRLSRHAAAGRPHRDDPDYRELIIPFGHTGYIALYRVSAAGDRVTILTIRHQREAGYTDE